MLVDARTPARFPLLRRGRSRIVGVAAEGDAWAFVVVDGARKLHGIRSVVCVDVVTAGATRASEVSDLLPWLHVEFAARVFAPVGEAVQALYAVRAERQLTLLAPDPSPHLPAWYETAWYDGIVRVPTDDASVERRDGGPVPMHVDWVPAFLDAHRSSAPSLLRSASVAAYGAHLAVTLPEPLLPRSPAMDW